MCHDADRNLHFSTALLYLSFGNTDSQLICRALVRNAGKVSFHQAERAVIIMSQQIDSGADPVVTSNGNWRPSSSLQWGSVALAAVVLIGLISMCGLRFIQLKKVEELLSTSAPSQQVFIDAQATIDEGTAVVDWILSWKRSAVESTLHGAIGAFVLNIKSQTQVSLDKSKDVQGFQLEVSLVLADERMGVLKTAITQLGQLEQGNDLRVTYKIALVREKEQVDTWKTQYNSFDVAFSELVSSDIGGKNVRIAQFRKNWKEVEYPKRSVKIRELATLRVSVDAHHLDELKRHVDELTPCSDPHNWGCQAVLAHSEVAAIAHATTELSEESSERSRLVSQIEAAELRENKFNRYRIVVREARELLDGGSPRELDSFRKGCVELNETDLEYLYTEVRRAIELNSGVVCQAAKDSLKALPMPATNSETETDLKKVWESVVIERKKVIANACGKLVEGGTEYQSLKEIASEDENQLTIARHHVAQYSSFDVAFSELVSSDMGGKNVRIAQFLKNWKEAEYPQRSVKFRELAKLRVSVDEHHLDELKRHVDELTPCSDPHNWGCQAVLAHSEVAAIAHATTELSEESSERSRLVSQIEAAELRENKFNRYRIVVREARELLDGGSPRELDSFRKGCVELNETDLEYLYTEVRSAVESRIGSVYRATMEELAKLPLHEKVYTDFDVKILEEEVSARKKVIEAALNDLPECEEKHKLSVMLSADSQQLQVRRQEIAFDEAKRQFDEQFERSAGAGAQVKLIKDFCDKFKPSVIPSRRSEIRDIASRLQNAEGRAELEKYKAEVKALEDSYSEGDPGKLQKHRNDCAELKKVLAQKGSTEYQALRNRLDVQINKVESQIGNGSYLECETRWNAFCNNPGSSEISNQFMRTAMAFLAKTGVPPDQSKNITGWQADCERYQEGRTKLIDAYTAFEATQRMGPDAEVNRAWVKVVAAASAAIDRSVNNDSSIKSWNDREYVECRNYVLSCNAGVEVSAQFVWFDVSGSALNETSDNELVVELRGSFGTRKTKEIPDLPSKNFVSPPETFESSKAETSFKLSMIDVLDGVFTEVDDITDDITTFKLPAVRLFSNAVDGKSKQTIWCQDPKAKLEIVFSGLPIRPTFAEVVKK